MDTTDKDLLAHRRRRRAFRYIRARPRLFGGFALALACFLVLPWHWSLATRVLIAWNAGSIAFLVSVLAMMLRSPSHVIGRRAAFHDEGKHIILALASLAAGASVVAIVFQLANVSTVTGLARALHMGLAALTILTSWSFLHVMFALHYAHEYHGNLGRRAEGAAPPPGLDIPGGDAMPDYLDFMYFSFVIGVASATADINIASRAIRRVALLHGVLSFFFNIAVLGLSINIASGLV